MKYAKKILILSCTFIVVTNLNNAAADLNADAEVIFNWAESKFSQFFPPHDTTKTLDVWLYRYYPTTKIYAGINTQENTVYVLGGAFGNTQLPVGSVAGVLEMTKEAGSVAACDNTKAPEGVSYLQNGNSVKITTNGQCVAVPAAGICVPPVSTATEISVLSRNDVKTFSFEGIVFSDPKLESAFTPLIKDAINVKTCIKNATQAFAAQLAETDVCFNVSARVNDFKALQGLLTFNPPVNLKMQSTILNEIVPDCFVTDAAIITDALTNEVWTKENGSFVPKK